VITATAPDGTDIITADEGAGPVILVLHGGMSDESPWVKVAAELAPRFRVVRIRRRIYRLELPADPATDYALEVADILAVAKAIGEPCLLVGHSSGAVVALETLVADSAPFSGVALYEPPLLLDRAPLGGDALRKARAALARGHVRTALVIFLRNMVGLPLPVTIMVRIITVFNRSFLKFVPRQIDDTDAINRLGVRLDAYAQVRLPALLVTGAKSPAHLRARTAALAGVLPNAWPVAIIPKQGHGAHTGSPGELAALIADFADQVGLVHKGVGNV
jgi:pimeloyl-ACP methyl ester carboxylesterase